MDIRAFCREQRDWLELELESDQQQQQGSGGSSGRTSVLHQLQTEQVSVGLYGRTVVQLAQNGDTLLLPSHRFTPGNEVEIRSKSSKSPYPAGVVSQVTETTISVALFGKKQQQQTGEEDDDDMIGEAPLSLLPKSSVEVHRKVVQALQDLERHDRNHVLSGRAVQSVMMDKQEAVKVVKENSSAQPITPFNPHLDPSQIEAIQFCLGNRPISLIHGPPGRVKSIALGVNSFASGKLSVAEGRELDSRF